MSCNCRHASTSFCSFAFPIFFLNDTATTEIYTLSLHDALPISRARRGVSRACAAFLCTRSPLCGRSEEHTSELQSRVELVCRLLLEKKKTWRSICRPLSCKTINLFREMRAARD